MDHTTIRIGLSILEALDTPLSLSVWIRLTAASKTESHRERRRLLQSITSARVHPHSYLDTPDGIERYKRDVQAVDLLRKFDFDTGVDKRSAALATFWKSEAECYHANARATRHIENGPFSPLDMRAGQYLLRVKSLIARILGPLPGSLSVKFSPGAAVGIVARSATIGDKIAENYPSVTSSCTPLLPFWWDTAWGRRIRDSQHTPSQVRGSQTDFVFKDGEIDRIIDKQPLINSVLQNFVGNTIQRRLGPFTDIITGKERHRRLAYQASIDRQKSTADLTRASDTIARRWVQFLLPGDWFEVLDSLRCTHTFVPDKDGRSGKWVRLEKFSAMGNGYTFELETLIFYAICVVMSETDDVSVFGDDIIVPTERLPDVLAMLSYCGFTVNQRKTFSTSFFRESCGYDFYKGVLVRPVYLYDWPASPPQWMTLHNKLKRIETNFGFSLSRSRQMCQSQVPVQVRKCIGPPSLGDIVFHVDAVLPWDTLHSIMEIRPQSLWEKFDSATQYATALSGVRLNSDFRGAGLISRGDPVGYRLIKVYNPLNPRFGTLNGSLSEKLDKSFRI